MGANGKYTLKKVLVAMVWIILSSGTVVLLIAAVTRKNNEHCASIDIDISGVQNNFFINKHDVVEILQRTNGGRLELKPLSSIDIALMETELQKSRWVKKAELFFDNNDVVEVKIMEREPIARIFTSSGESFYMDSSLARLPLSDKFSARLPVFTDFPAGTTGLSQTDSNLLRDIRTISEFIVAQPFWMAQIEQVAITAGHTFDLIPKLGSQVIHFGKVDNCREKFDNLLCFYKQVLSKKGWNQYSSVDVQFKGQIVGTRRGAQEFKSDSLRSVQIMKAIIAEAQKHTNDSTNIQLEQPEDNNNNIITSPVIETVPDEDIKANSYGDNKNRITVVPAHVPEKPVMENHPDTKKIVVPGHVPYAEKSHISKKKVVTPRLEMPSQNKQKPKAVMPAASDY